MGEQFGTIMAETTAVGTQDEKVGLGKKSMSFFDAVVREMRKVSWPSREALQDATVITLAMCVLIALFTFGVDKIFEVIIRTLFRVL